MKIEKKDKRENGGREEKKGRMRRGKALLEMKEKGNTKKEDDKDLKKNNKGNENERFKEKME